MSHKASGACLRSTVRTSARESSFVTRAQPWLGTFVEIRAEASEVGRADLLAAVDAAYAEIAGIHRLLSRQDHGADYVTLAAAPEGAVVQVDTRTAELLQLCLQLSAQSAGRFTAEYVDRTPLAQQLSQPPAWSIDAPDRVRILRRTRPDFDGVAKGYAVDRAIGVLTARGMDGTVNAGGDLRTTRKPGEALHVRCGSLSAGLINLGTLRDGACATSQTTTTHMNRAAGLAGEGVEDRSTTAANPVPDMTITVAAPTCALADALTKVVAAGLDESVDLLRQHGAAAWIMREIDGALRIMQLGTSSVLIPHVA